MSFPTSLGILKRPLPDFGVTYGPADDTPRPAIMFLHGSEGGWGGWNHAQAILFAAHGFLTLPYCYSVEGNSWNAGDIRDIPLDRSADALAALRADPRCDGAVGIFGVSRGGEHALLLASLMARDGIGRPPEAVAVHGAADVVCGAFSARYARDPGDPGWRSWDPAERAWTWRGSSESLLPTTPIEIERYRGALLLSHGVDDPVWSVEMTRRLASRARAAGLSPEVHLHEGQGHGFECEGTNRFNALLLSFFQRHLSGSKRPLKPPAPSVG